MEGTEPPMLETGPFGNKPLIYVPDGSVDTYKAAPDWSKYAANIYPMSEYGSH